MDVDVTTAIATVAALVAYIEVRVRSAVDNATAHLPKRRDDAVVPRRGPERDDA